VEQKPIAWRRAQVVTQTQYEDGSGHISDLCFASGASARIVGNGSTQAPLDVVLTPAERAAGELLEALRAVAEYEDDEPAPGTRGAEVYAQVRAVIAKVEAGE